jgi:hypothetical protein
MRWNYVVRQRHRWSSDRDARKRQAERLQQDLQKLGVTFADLRQLHGIVEVTIPDSELDENWEARILPWEYVLAASTNPIRVDESILVVRHLATGRPKPSSPPRRYSIIETAPGELASRFDFSAERSLVRGSLRGMQAFSEGVIGNPTRSQLVDHLNAFQPDVVHFTGIDNRAGRQILGLDQTGVRDGLLLADASGQAQEYRAEAIAELLTDTPKPPTFIGFHCWDSGARMAPMAIHAGIDTAIGFQHTFDEAVAEIFFLNFYRAAVATDWDCLAAFSRAWASVAGFRRRMRGSSIILWSGHSLLAEAAKAERTRPSMREESAIHRGASVTERRVADPRRDSVTKLLSLTVKPKPQLNYSSLHNGESVFDEFTFRFQSPPPSPRSQSAVGTDGDATEAVEASEPVEASVETVSRIDDLDIEILLHVGTDAFPFRTRVSLDAHSLRHDLVASEGDQSATDAIESFGGIRLPLTSQLFRSISERIQTSLYVSVCWHDQVLYRHTHSIWLAPVDQWTLNDRQIGWLPSFVQPRDPAVASTINRGQRFLQCLADRVSIGFDGYQSYDPFADGIDRWSGVDLQVRAIWAALLLNSDLRYINPPPSYSEFTQRLRTPGETIEGGFGTCVDLAILLAACLEWVEIHPVLFLLHGHVFPGYWKDLESHRRFLDVLTDDLPAARLGRETTDEHATQGWVSGARTYSEIKGFVDRGELIPLETVALTRAGGFRQAIEDAKSHFVRRRNRSFRAMIDLVSARQRDGVTPIPLVPPDHRSPRSPLSWNPSS